MTVLKPYDQLIDVLDAYIDQFEGGMRIRGVKTALLIHRATLEGRGMTISELARATDAPVENVRRHIAKHVELGALRYEHDPDDERVVRVLAVDVDRAHSDMAAMLQRVKEIVE